MVREANKEKVKVNNKAYREANKEKVKASNEAWREAKALEHTKLRRPDLLDKDSLSSK